MKSAKAWTATVGPLIAGVLETYSGLPTELCVTIGSVVAGLLTYFIPNKEG